MFSFRFLGFCFFCFGVFGFLADGFYGLWLWVLFWVFGVLGFWIFGFLVFCCLGSWGFVVLVFVFLGFWVFGFLDFCFFCFFCCLGVPFLALGFLGVMAWFLWLRVLGFKGSGLRVQQDFEVLGLGALNVFKKP